MNRLFGEGMPMGLVGLAWYISGMTAALAVMFSAITWAPAGPGPVERALPAVFAAGSLLAAAVALGLGQLPPEHWVRRSRSLRAAFVVAGLSVTLLVVLIG